MGIALAALVVAASGGAYAAVKSTTPTITACVHQSGGGLYTAHRCARHDRRLRWNVSGPPGPATGAAGGALAGSYPNPTLATDVVTDRNVRPGSLTGASINPSTLGKVPSAGSADAAGHATNSDQLGGSPASAFQSRVTGTCGASSGINQINNDGSVACGHVQFYSGRLVEPLNGSDTFLTIPGVAHLTSLNCQAANANAQLWNDAPGTTDIWVSGDTSYVGTNWFSVASTFAATSGTTWHLGQGSGTGAKAITITVSSHATGTNCIFQATAEVMTAG